MQSMDKMARLSLALKDFANENSYNALAISCWTRLREEYGMVPCAVISRLNNQGLIAACEADFDGAIGMLIESSLAASRHRSLTS